MKQAPAKPGWDQPLRTEDKAIPIRDDVSLKLDALMSTMVHLSGQMKDLSS